MNTDNITEEYTQIFGALSHPIRLNIACGLMNCEKCNVNTISQKLGISQSLVSQHIKILKTAKVIKGVREGNVIWYSLTSELTKQLLSNVNLKLCE